MGKKSRDKGAAFEREVAKLISPYFPDAKRNLDQYQASDGRDLSDTQPLCIQCKRRKKVDLWEIKMGWLEAEQSTSIEYPYPIVIWRDDGQEAFCMMKVEHLIEWLCLMEDGEL